MRSPSFTTSFAKASIQIAILLKAPIYNIWVCKYRSSFVKKNGKMIYVRKIRRAVRDPAAEKSFQVMLTK
jgi:hypothetical protein